jgi:hypothetical protein
VNAPQVQFASDLAKEQRMNTIRVYKESWRRIEQANRIGIDFLVADLNVGLTFLQIADVTRSPATRARDLDKALQVYRTVKSLLPRLFLSAEDGKLINTKLAELRFKLKQAGYSLSSLELDS